MTLPCKFSGLRSLGRRYPNRWLCVGSLMLWDKLKFSLAARVEEEEEEVARCLKRCRLPFMDWVCSCRWLANNTQLLNRKVGKWCLCPCVMMLRYVYYRTCTLFAYYSIFTVCITVLILEYVYYRTYTLFAYCSIFTVCITVHILRTVAPTSFTVLPHWCYPNCCVTASSNCHHLTRTYFIQPSLTFQRNKHHPPILVTQNEQWNK